MTRVYYQSFNQLARRGVRSALLRWLHAQPRRVVSVIGNGHDVYLRWEPCEPRERTTGVAVLKFRSGHDDLSRPIRRLNTTPTLIVHADGSNGFFLFVFYRCRRTVRRQPLAVELL